MRISDWSSDVCSSDLRLHVGEGGQHHLHLGRLEYAGIVLHVAVVHLDVRLGEAAEDLAQQVALAVGEVAIPVLHVLGQRHLFRPPVQALLHQRSEENTSELQSLMRHSYAVFCLTNKIHHSIYKTTTTDTEYTYN